MTTSHSHTFTAEALDGTSLETLLVALAPLDPLPARADAMRERVLAIARRPTRDQAQNLTIAAAAGRWERVAPKVEMKVLQDSPACKTVLYRFEPGGVLPAHHHRGEEECIVLEGEAQTSGVHVRRGDYHLAFENTDHSEVCSPTGAVLYVRHSRHPAVSSP